MRYLVEQIKENTSIAPPTAAEVRSAAAVVRFLSQLEGGVDVAVTEDDLNDTADVLAELERAK